MGFDEELDALIASARMVDQQAYENPGVGIPVDPDLAEFMGADDFGDALPEEFREGNDYEPKE